MEGSNQLEGMKDPLAQQRKTGSAVPLPFDEFKLGHMAFDHTIIDPPGEPSSHCLFVFLNPCGQGPQFRDVALLHLG